MPSFKADLAQASSSGDGRKVLHIWVDEGDNVIRRKWGKEDGKLQSMEKEVSGKNIGRSNETTPHQQAIADAEKLVTRKIKEGYRDIDDDAGQDESQEFCFDPIPPNFAPTTPMTDPPKGVTFDGGYEKYFAERKNNGVNLWKVTRLDGEVDWYTRGAKKITHIVEDIKPLQDFANANQDPGGSLVSVEFILYNEKGREIPAQLKGIVSDKTSREKSLARYEQHIDANYTFAVKAFDVLFWNTEFCGDIDYFERRSIIHTAYWINHPEYKSACFETLTPEIIAKAYALGWEGFILRLLRGEKSHVTFTMNGKPSRRGCWKFKFQETDDYIVTHVQKGASGRLLGRLNKFQLNKYDETGELIIICSAGPGTLTTAELDELALEILPNIEEVEAGVWIPVDMFGVEVKFSDKQPDTNALEHPVIMELRPDKPLRECLLSDAPRLFKG